VLSVDAINTCLPQTQCTRCGYPSCRDYATAIYEDKANINLCPPGDEVTIAALSKVTQKPALPLDLTVGPAHAKTLAFIDETRCIGCVLCIKACPVDAILGANKQMHTVIQAHCTGCELCLPVCPTDCIDMQALSPSVSHDSPWPGYAKQDVELSEARFEQRSQRLAAEIALKKTITKPKGNKMDEILAAVRRRQSAK
jgi:electron transport complex protein RnfB